MLTRREIERLLPHGAAMVMLDRVRSCDDASIVCSTRGHRLPDHPLAVDGKLPALAGVEFAAQAMALHEALKGGSCQAAARPGRLVGLRGLELLVETLDEREGELVVTATLLGAQADSARYGFEISHDDAPLLRGQAFLLLL